jgi:hypothetical protein
MEVLYRTPRVITCFGIEFSLVTQAVARQFASGKKALVVRILGLDLLPILR